MIPAKAFLCEDSNVGLGVPNRTAESSSVSHRETEYIYERWRDIQGDVFAGQYSKGMPSFGTVKSIERILEKTERCYKGDYSRVTDMCRCAITFDNLQVQRRPPAYVSERDTETETRLEGALSTPC